MACPLSDQDIFYGMLNGKFTEMTDHDYDGFAGMEYDGYIGEMDNCLVVLDVGPSAILVNVSDDDGAVWAWEITAGCATQIC